MASNLTSSISSLYGIEGKKQETQLGMILESPKVKVYSIIAYRVTLASHQIGSSSSKKYEEKIMNGPPPSSVCVGLHHAGSQKFNCGQHNIMHSPY